MIIKGTTPGKVSVSFCLHRSLLADSIQVVGDFNDWNRRSHPLTCEHENGAWQPNIEHEKVQEYHFRYLIDGKNWQNEWHADRSIPNPFGGENSIQEI